MLLRSISSCRLRAPSLNIPGKPASYTDITTCNLLSKLRGSCRSERGLSEKIRDPKDFTWQSGRPDDPKKNLNKKWSGRPEGACEQRKLNNRNTVSQAKKASDVKNPHMWTGRPKDSCGSNKKQPRLGTEEAVERHTAGNRRYTGRSEDNLKVSEPKGKLTESASTEPKKGSDQNSGKGKGFDNKANFVGASKPLPDIRSSINTTIVNVETCETGLAPPGALSSSIITPERIISREQTPSCLHVEGTKMDSKPSELIAVHEEVSARVGGILGQQKAVGIDFNAMGVVDIDKVGTLYSAATSLEPIKTAHKSDGPSIAVEIPICNVITQRSSLRPPGVSKEKLSTGVSAEVVQTKPLPDRAESLTQTSGMKPSVSRSGSVKIQKMPKLKVVKETYNEKRRHRVYSFGLSETGALGLYKPNEGRRWRKFISRPLRHQFAEETRVVSAETGYGFTLFYVKSENNVKLYGCGLNTDFQLGPTVAEVVTYPSPIDIHINSPNTKIISFSAGRAHSVVATDNEGVFLFGSNSYGQCGRAVDENDKSARACTITQIKSFGGKKAVMVNCGQDHTCFVTELGEVYSCGWGSEGQTGLGHTSHSCEPSLVQGDIEGETIVKVTGKCDTVLALNDKGELFGWGSNEFRQILDDRDAPQINSPLRLAHINLVCGKIVDIAAGSSFCMALNQDGDVYVWGCGILGGGPELDRTTVPTLLPRTLFGTNEYQPKVIPLRVYCGLDHMAVMNSLNHIYSWGKNKHGCLGIGSARDQYFPYKLSVSANAVHVSCAVDHSVIVTDHS